MTVIALLSGETTPYLISDMLLSLYPRKYESHGNVFLPTLGDLDTWENTTGIRLPFNATRTVRKPFNIGAFLHVAWAGSLSAGRDFRSNLVTLSKGHQFTQSLFQEAIDLLELEQQKGFSAILIQLPEEEDPQKWRAGIKIYSHGCQSYHSKRWGECFLGGSGSEAIKSWLEARDRQWLNQDTPDPHELTAELICAKLIFSESLIHKASPRNKPARILNEGCGGFFEALRFAPGGVKIPRTAFHLNLKAKATGELELTRFYVYRSVIDPNFNGRVALLCSAADLPLRIPRDIGRVSLELPRFDFIVCPSAWNETTEAKHIHLLSDKPAEFFAEDMVPKVVTVSIFGEDTPVSDDLLDRLDLDLQLALLENPTSPSKQSAFLVDVTDPLIQLKVVNQCVSLEIQDSWIQDLVHRFHDTLSDPLFVSSS